MSGSERYRVVVGDAQHEVEWLGGDDVIRIRVDGRTLEVHRGADESLRVVAPDDEAEPGSHTRVWLARERHDTFLVAAAGETASVTVQTASQAALLDALAVTRKGTAGQAKIASPMPGRVVKTLVEPGQAVTEGQTVCIVEAMKMENEIRSPREGVVQTVAVVAGETVDAGRVLVELVPHGDS